MRTVYALRIAAFFLAACCLIGGWPARGAVQTEGTGELTAVVLDASGNPVRGASVALASEAGATRTAATDDEGRFRFTGLAAGVYAATISLRRHQEARVDGIDVGADPVTLPAITLAVQVLEEEIVVTATRTEERLAQVPLSISVVTGSDIEERAIDNLTELARWTPGLTVIDQGARGSNVVVARGLHTDSIAQSEAAGNNYNNGVATYIGDIPVAVDLRLQDIERVEVLLGPQGTLYGAGTLAGAVRYLPRRPDTAQRSLEVRGDLFALQHGGAPGSDAGLTFNLPLAPGRLALRGSVDRFSDPGFIDYDYLLRTPGVSEPEPDFSDAAAVAANLRSERDANTEDTLSSRLSLLWAPTPNGSAILSYHLQDQDVGGRQVSHSQSFDTGPYVSAHRYLEPNTRKNELLSLELSWDFRTVEFTSAAGYSRFRSHGQRDQTDLLIQEFGIGGLLPATFPTLEEARTLDPDLTLADFVAGFRAFSSYTREDGLQERWNWESRLVSTGDGPWRWVAGAFLNRFESEGISFEFAPGLTEFSGVVPVLGGAAQDEPVEYYSRGLLQVDERALFGEVSRLLGDRWRVTAGGRWFDYHVVAGNQTEFPYTPLYNSPLSEYDSEDRGHLVKGSISYLLNERTNLYFSRTEGYRIGGGNNYRVCTDEELALFLDADESNDPPQSSCIYANQALIRPDRTANYELGLRRSWKDGRFTASATLFHVDWTEIQVSGVTPFSGEGITVNGGAAVSRGVELAATAALTDRFSLRASWSTTRAELNDDSPGLLGRDVDTFSGDRLPGSPEHQGSLVATYARPLGRDTFFELLYGYTYNGDVLTRIGMRAGGEKLPAFDLHNLSASIARNAWRLTFYAENLFDEYAVTGVRNTRDLIGMTEDGFRSRRYFVNVLRPRRAGVRVRYFVW